MTYFNKIQFFEKPASIDRTNQIIVKRSGTLRFADFFNPKIWSNMLTVSKVINPFRKLLLFFPICTMLYSCVMERDLQAQITFATLVKVDEVHRYPYVNKKMYTWETDKFVSFVTFESSSLDIPIGTKTRLLVFR